MKRIIFCLCVFFSVFFSSLVNASDQVLLSTLIPEDFSEKIFDDLTIGSAEGGEVPILIKNVTVTGTMIFNSGQDGSACMVFFSGSDLNRVEFFCRDGEICELYLDGSSNLKELNLHAGVGSSIKVSGMIPRGSDFPGFYSNGYLCDGQPEFAAYIGAEISIDYQLRDLDVFSDLGKIDTIRIHAADDAAVTFDNVWLHRTFLLADGDRSPRNFTVNTTGFAFIDLLDSGISFGLHNLNSQHLPHGHGLNCSYIAGDQMNIGLLLLHSDADLTVSMDRQYIDYVVFFGNGCDHSTLRLDAYAGSSQVSDIYQVHVYDANAELYNKLIQGVYFLLAPDEAPYSFFYHYFNQAENLLRNHRSDFADPEMLPYLPDTDSSYWDWIDAALIWSQLMPYYNITPTGMAPDGVSTVYSRSEPNVPYIYYHAAIIEKVRVLNAYGSSDGQLPDYIKQKNWASPNPFISGSAVRLCENGGCGFNHNMSMGTVSFRTSISDIPDK